MPDFMHINRIKVEFKGGRLFLSLRRGLILIESKWNLKEIIINPNPNFASILIESKWNLKTSPNASMK